MKKVSVVLPVYNVEKYVEAALKSALAQTYPNTEILIINDGSFDQSIAICKKFDDDRISIIHQENKGLAEARNTGLRHATGDYVAFLDGDDIWLPQKIEKHISHLEDASEVGISFSRSAFINEAGLPLKTYQMPRLQNITPEYMLRCNPLGNGSAGVFRKAVFEEIGFEGTDQQIAYFDQDFKRAEDTECLLRILVQTSWVIEGIPEALTLYRISSGTLSADLEKTMIFGEKVMAKARTYAPELIRESGKKVIAYMRRDLARESVRRRNPSMAYALIHQAIKNYPQMLLEEFRATLTVLTATHLLVWLPRSYYLSFEKTAIAISGNVQERRISKDVSSDDSLDETKQPSTPQGL
ncbi:MAG: glycosyltransferase [Phormidesmis sp.]